MGGTWWMVSVPGSHCGSGMRVRGVGTQLRKLYQESFKDKHLSLHPVHILIAQGPLVGTPLCYLS